MADHVVALGPPGLNQRNLVTAYHWHLWSSDQSNRLDKDGFLADAEAFQKPCEDDEDSSEEDPSKEFLYDAAKPQQLPQTP